MLPMLSRCVRRCRPFALLLVLIACSSCAAFSIEPGRTGGASTVELSIRQAEAAGRPGVYVISGSTSLPDQTRITVAAVRDFPAVAANAQSAYAILDRQFATVQRGSWEATLNLWQVAPDGRFQESWQLSDLTAAADPAPTVAFLATLDPINQSSAFKSQIEAQDDATQATLARFTTDGELYLEASKRVNVPLPSGRTVPPAAAVAPSVRTSGQPAETADRDPQSWSQTNAPLSPDTLMR